METRFNPRLSNLRWQTGFAQLNCELVLFLLISVSDTAVFDVCCTYLVCYSLLHLTSVKALLITRIERNYIVELNVEIDCRCHDNASWIMRTRRIRTIFFVEFAAFTASLFVHLLHLFAPTLFGNDYIEVSCSKWAVDCILNVTEAC
jgi:hypothetical protein